MYEHFGNELDEAERQAQNDHDLEQFDLIAPQTQQAALEEVSEECSESEKYIAFNPNRPEEQTNYDIGVDIGLSAQSVEIVKKSIQIA